MGYLLTTGALVRDGLIDMTTRDPADWRVPPYPMSGRHMGAVFLGDAEAGPFVALNSVEPADAPYTPAPGHGHRSDSWRISLKGKLRVGAQSYAPGGFRFQEAGLLYGVDDVGWGPERAYSVVMMADRRGATAIPADPANAERFKAAAAGFDAWLGRPPRQEYPVVAGVATTLGAPRFGWIDGSIAETARWDGIAPGLKVAIGLCGDLQAGPVVVLVAAEPGAIALPSLRIDAEVLQMVVGGEGQAATSVLRTGDTRLVEAGCTAPAFRATAQGAWLAVVIGDRRAVAKADIAGELGGYLRRTVDVLHAQLEGRTAH